MLNGVSAVGFAHQSYFNTYAAPAAARGWAGAAVTNPAVRAAGVSVYTAAIPAAQPETPVQPVSPVKAVPEATLDKEALLRRLETDPAAAIVRSRIQYLGDPDSSAGDANRPDGPRAPDGAEENGLRNPLSDKGESGENRSAREVAEDAECQTCKRRKYQDGSDDPGVSFKTPTHVSPEQAASAVRGHEHEHVVREQAEADRTDRKVVSQSVTYHNEICPECGRVYVSGGTTRTVTAEASEPGGEEEVGLPLPNVGQEEDGKLAFS